ncbi:MAG TPA: MerR family transcriptional regulator [Actinocrinis sp.]|nr:MerR family transcriptional regulator [Actinocrinis sp.]
MRSIGEMARDSGLGVSALRFYDRAGVLVPARVDPASGYRWYGDEQLGEARLLARLRRTGMPLADVRLVLAGWSSADTDLVRTLLRSHLSRLERGLAEARSEFSTVRALLDSRENPMTSPLAASVRVALRASDLAAALDSVRFAAADPNLPVLGGVLFDVDGDSLRVVATDRHRMALARAGITGHVGPRTQAIVPSALVDAMRALLDEDGPVQFTVDGDRVALEAGDRQAAGLRLDHDFPDYRRILQVPTGRRALVDVSVFREAVRSGPVRVDEPGEAGEAPSDLTLLKVVHDGARGDTVGVCEDDGDDRDRIAVSRSYLLNALDAGAQDHLVLELGASTAPMAIRRTDTDEAFSILMPVRLTS